MPGAAGSPTTGKSKKFPVNGESMPEPQASVRAAARGRRAVRSHRLTENSRVFALKLSVFYQEASRLQRAIFGGDIDLFIVAGAIAVATIESRMRDQEFRQRFASLATVIEEDLQRGCNASSIAQATGMPRETVRRRIKRLIEMGIVVRRAAGDYVLRAGVVQAPAYDIMFRQLSDAVLRLVNDCLEEEVFAVDNDRDTNIG
jgi:DNA-binding transcriptional ArsR family regulator